MNLGEYLKSELEKIYLGKIIKGDNGNTFKVENITFFHPNYGEPPIEIVFQTKNSVFIDCLIEDWNSACEKKYVTQTEDLKQKIKDREKEVYYITNFKDELPEIL